DTAQRTRKKAGCEGTESGDRSTCAAKLWEKHLVENERRRRSVDNKVVKFDRGADQACDGCPFLHRKDTGRRSAHFIGDRHRPPFISNSRNMNTKCWHGGTARTEP